MKRMLQNLDEQNQQEDVSETGTVHSMFRLNQYGKVKKSVTNLQIALDIMLDEEKIGFNEFNQIITHGADREPIDDSFISFLRLEIDRRHDVTFSKEDVFSTLELLAREKRAYHPVKEMIESKEWDNVQRVDSIFIDYLGATDDEYTRQVARKWLIGGIARIYEAGVKFEVVPVLNGKQGVGKSTLAARLGGDYFTDSLNALGESKDDYQQLIGKWIIELGELSSMKKTDTDKIKNFLSATSDDIRLPYDRITKSFKRTCIFIGTTNNDEYLTDLSGNRRFYPIPLGNEPLEDVFSLSSDVVQQIWAEAKLYYDIQEDIFMDESIEAMANEYRKQASKKELFYQDIEDFLEMKVPADWEGMKLFEKRLYYQKYLDSGRNDRGTESIKKTTAKELARVVFDLEGGGKGSNGVLNKINLYMSNLDGWNKQSIWIDGKTQKGFKYTG